MAEIHHAETVEQHATALALVEELTRARRAFRAEARESDALAERNLARRRANLQALEDSAHDLMENARKRHRGDLALLERGLLAAFQADLSERDVDFARRSLFDVMRRRDDLEAGELSRQARLRAQLTDAEINLVAAGREVEELEIVVESWRLTAAISGRVTEVKARAGAVLQTGQSVPGVGGGEDGLDVLLSVPPAESLSEFPASVDSMAAVLQNRELAEAFSVDGAPYAGPIESEVESQPPISLVVASRLRQERRAIGNLGALAGAFAVDEAPVAEAARLRPGPRRERRRVLSGRPRRATTSGRCASSGTR